MGATAGLVIAGVGTGISAIGQKKAATANQNIAFLNAQTLEQTGALNASLIEQGTATNVGALEWNANMAEAQARDAVVRGREAETFFRKDIRATIGSQRAAFGASGVDVTQGSALDVQANTAYQGELAALTIRTNAMREAWGFHVESQDYLQQAAATKKMGALEAQNTRAVAQANARSARLGGTYAGQAGTYGAASTLLAGAASVASTLRKK